MCLQHIMFFCSAVFCKGLRRGKSFRSGCWLPLGGAMGPRCACRGEASVVRGGRGANGRGGHGSSCLHRIMFFCSAVFCKGFRMGKGSGSSYWLLLGSAMGPRCACRGEAGVVWCYDADMAEYANLTKGDMHLARTPISTPPSAQVSRRSRGVPGTLVLPDRGSGGRQRGLGGHENFADRDLEKNGRGFSCLYGLQALFTCG